MTTDGEVAALVFTVLIFQAHILELAMREPMRLTPSPLNSVPVAESAPQERKLHTASDSSQEQTMVSKEVVTASQVTMTTNQTIYTTIDSMLEPDRKPEQELSRNHSLTPKRKPSRLPKRCQKLFTKESHTTAGEILQN